VRRSRSRRVTRLASVNAAGQQPEDWIRMSILNTARSANFSSDPAIRKYGRRIWQAQPVTITAD